MLIICLVPYTWNTSDDKNWTGSVAMLAPPREPEQAPVDITDGALIMAAFFTVL